MVFSCLEIEEYGDLGYLQGENQTGESVFRQGSDDCRDIENTGSGRNTNLSGQREDIRDLNCNNDPTDDHVPLLPFPRTQPRPTTTFRRVGNTSSSCLRYGKLEKSILTFSKHYPTAVQSKGNIEFLTRLQSFKHDQQ